MDSLSFVRYTHNLVTTETKVNVFDFGITIRIRKQFCINSIAHADVCSTTDNPSA